jgi:hypothetical protein
VLAAARRRPAAIRGAVAVAVAVSIMAIGAATVALGARSAPIAAGPIPRASAPLNAPSALPTPPGTTERVSVGADGRQGNGGSGGASAAIDSMNGNQAISADGRWVAFASAATNLIPGEPHPAGGIFLRDRQTGTTVAIPWVDGGVFPAAVTSAEPTISGDGAVVAFTAIVSNAGAARAVAISTKNPYVLAWDRATNLTELVSMDGNGRPTPGYQPSISADGRYVAYTRWFLDNTPPVLSNLTTDGFPSGGQFFVFGPSAPCTPHSATITVTATDPDDAVAEVTLSYQPNGGGVLTQAMSNVGGTTWRTTIAVQDAWSTGQITYSVQGRDSNGNVSQPLSPGSGFVLNKGECIL